MSDVISAICPACGNDSWAGKRQCTVYGEVSSSWCDQENNYGETNHYRLLKCNGCQTIFMHTTHTNSEDFTWDCDYDNIRYIETYSTYPDYKNKGLPPSWVMEIKDKNLYNIMSEMYSARNSNSLILASIGLRTAFDRSSELIGIPANEPFNKKIKLLFEQGEIGSKDMELLNVLTDAGSAAAHRGWRPSEEEFDILLNILQSFVERKIVFKLTPEKLGYIKSNIPPKKPKK
ncbi:DUF4145 domain-containing protein [Providencia rettgeri]|uniref:DUF4145 domain-containing protein n=1 Tax=Providencia rettgeri TaxID=587 RepID=UPI0032EB8DC9